MRDDRFAPLRVFPDTNILISASLSPSSRFLDFWRLRAVVLVTSPVVIREARKHLNGVPLERFEHLLLGMEEIEQSRIPDLQDDIELVEKDRPILAAAIAGRADFLVTGDKNHFGHLYGMTIAETTILPPVVVLDEEEYRIGA